MSHICFNHSSTDGNLGCFHVLVTVNNAAINIGVLCSFKLVFWVPSDIFPEVGLLGQKADPFLILWGIPILLSTVAAPVCIPTNSAKGCPFRHTLASTCLLIYWWWPFWQVWDDISLCFNLHFLMISDIEHIFICVVYWPLVCPLWRCLFRFLAHFLIGLFVYFWCWVL